MDFDVTVDREVYIGGSDIPAIMGISTFKTRWDLLQEKAGLKEIDFHGNKYTVYGQKMEPKIRAYINEELDNVYVPNKTTIGDIRCHTDGFNGEAVLEIKTTSTIYESLDEYKVYLVQLLKYMEVNNVEWGVLAVYERPEDFSLEFDPDRLRVFPVRMCNYIGLLNEVNKAIDKFRHDLERLKNNPLLSEEDFLDTDLVSLSNRVVVFENRLAQMKQLEQQCKEAKRLLCEEMTKHGVKSWSTPNGTKITLIVETPATYETALEFDTGAFKAEHKELYQEYLREVQKKKGGRSAYVKITLPK